MFVRKAKYDAERERARVSGRALAEMTSELIDGLSVLGHSTELDGEDVTTAGLTVRALVNVTGERDRLSSDLDSARIALKAAESQLADARAEAEDLRPDATRYRVQKAKRCANLTPGGKPHRKRADGTPATH